MPFTLSIIVPVHNGAATLAACLEALNHGKDDGTEILVIDDRSTDGSAAIAQDAGVRAVPNAHARGPAGARNHGAELASGDILLFVDADVVVPKNAISLIRETFAADPKVSAVFGSYDTEPAEPNFLSQYKNLFHHYVHQAAREDSSSFWAGCGAIRAAEFRKLSGFNEADYPHPSIEDIELGWRLSRSGGRIRLEKSLQAKHLKRWSATGLLKADILRRALPWTRLIAVSGHTPNDLNLSSGQRISAALAWGCAVSAGLCLLPCCRPAALCLAIACALGVIALNAGFYRFFLRHRGVMFTAGVFFWHLLYFLYSSAVFAIGWPCYRIRNRVTGRV